MEYSYSCESCFLFQASDQGIPGDKNQETKQNEEDSGEPAAKRPHGKISLLFQNLFHKCQTFNYLSVLTFESFCENLKCDYCKESY